MNDIHLNNIPINLLELMKLEGIYYMNYYLEH